MQPFSRRETQPRPVEAQGNSACALAFIGGGIARILEAATLAQATTGNAVDVSSILKSIPKELDCNACGGRVGEIKGRLVAPGCTSTGSCELSWAELHDATYRDKSGKPLTKRVPCGGFMCAAVIIVSEEPGGKPGIEGTCTVDAKGKEWQATAMQMLNSMRPVRPEDGIEVFDGENTYIPPAE